VAVFTSPVLDNFNRTENPLSTGWQGATTIFTGSVSMRANGSQVSTQALGTTPASSVTTVTALNGEAYVTFNQLENLWWFGLAARIQNPGTGTAACYAAQITRGSGPAFISCGRLSTFPAKANEIVAPLGSAPGGQVPLVSGDKLGLRVFDYGGMPMVEAWYYSSVASNWVRWCAWRDWDPSAAIRTSGYFGLYGVGQLTFTLGDDFGAGTITAPGITVNPDWTGVTGALPDPISAEVGGGIVVPSTPAFIAARADPLSERIRSTAPNNFFTKDLESTGGGISVSV